MSVPQQPVAGVAFNIQVTVSGCLPGGFGNATVNGSNIDIVWASTLCGLLPPTPETRAAGPLPAGTYTIRILSDNFVAATPPVMIAAAVPVIDWRLLALLAVVLAFFAIRSAAT